MYDTKGNMRKTKKDTKTYREVLHELLKDDMSFVYYYLHEAMNDAKKDNFRRFEYVLKEIIQALGYVRHIKLKPKTMKKC